MKTEMEMPTAKESRMLKMTDLPAPSARLRDDRFRGHVPTLTLRTAGMDGPPLTSEYLYLSSRGVQETVSVRVG